MSNRFAPISPGDRTITSLCRMCEQGCGLEVLLGPDGRPVRVKGDKRHPYSRGWLCVKGLAALDFFSSPLSILSLAFTAQANGASALTINGACVSAERTARPATVKSLITIKGD